MGMWFCQKQVGADRLSMMPFKSVKELVFGSGAVFHFGEVDFVYRCMFVIFEGVFGYPIMTFFTHTV